ncbi:MAG: UvrD-helicase domain-containing protein, partial [Magnetococcales bacterium]|nr:UvrD-helicase domain-containing protein [Magnetococcales bacterium]
MNNTPPLAPLADADARLAAIDPHHSFIVQAPAGSGKTGLLTQRLLRLLAEVEHPEEVLAITFTRKAAAEMQGRLLAALQAAATEREPLDPFLQQTHRLAVAVLARDQAANWRLLANPGRLRLMTMDALAAYLTRQLPVLSRMGGSFRISDDAEVDYRQAARATLAAGREPGRWSEPIALLLDHLDNRMDRVEALLARLLARRDQWLYWLGGQPLLQARDGLQRLLRQIVIEGLQTVDRALAREEKEPLWQLTLYAGEQLRRKQVACRLAAMLPESPAPGCAPEDLPAWLAMGDWLLTREGGWRKQVDQRIGFPPATQGGSPAEQAWLGRQKKEAVAWLAHCAERPALRQALAELRLLPPTAYSEGQWTILSALLPLLPMAVAQLRIRFQMSGQVDFAEVAMRAEEALGDPQQPSHLALQLDYRVRHLLVDEFQDTSQGQFRLIERLVAGWQAGDGRTLFLVGDPMQSIYRFREAEVGLFLRAQQQGIGMLGLRSLSLTSNFRSQAALVAWVNDTFPTLFPARDEMAEGAVRFHAAVASRPPLPGEAVVVHPCRDEQEEAEQLVALLTQARHDGEETAILVRSRSHLRAILPRLQQAGLPYQGVDLASLASSMVIQDLLSLTRALLFPADRIAWLSVLRAPWCGLSLPDLTRLLDEGGQAEVTTIVQLLDREPTPSLSAEGQQRWQRVATILRQAIAQRRRCQAFPGISTLRFWLESCWCALGGPATVPNKAELHDAYRYFALLASCERGGDLADWGSFVRRVDSLYAGADAKAPGGVSIMTIHKAKGLEFDTVIVPGLHRSPRAEGRELLSWQVLDNGILLGPLKRVDQEEEDPIQNYVMHLQRKKAEHEARRLLYVAVTRAKKRLHLCASRPKEGKEPPGRSFLALLWPALQQRFAPTEAEREQLAREAVQTPQGRRVLAVDWHSPPAPPPLQPLAIVRTIEEAPVEFAR